MCDFGYNNIWDEGIKLGLKKVLSLPPDLTMSYLVNGQQQPHLEAVIAVPSLKISTRTHLQEFTQIDACCRATHFD